MQAYFKNNKSVIATHSSFGEGLLFLATTLFLMETLIEFGLSGWKKLAVRLKQEIVDDA